MIIKITEQARGWSLWVTEKPGDDQPPIYTASGRTRDQIVALLSAITDDAPPPVVEAPVETADMRKHVQSQVLYSMLLAVDGWVQGARENHDACDHRGENTGEECWRSFAPSDIRAMINDVCRELHISEFPVAAHNVEDR